MKLSNNLNHIICFEVYFEKDYRPNNTPLIVEVLPGMTLILNNKIIEVKAI